MEEKKKSFLDDLAAEKPESFNEEVFIKSKRNYVPLIILSTLAIIIFSVLYFTFTKGSLVPDMTDWKEQEVYAWANANHGTVVKEDAYSLETADGILISQDIAPGAKLRRNGTLKVVISRGPDPNEEINFPDIKSMNLDDIETWISDNQLQGVTIKKENNSVFDKDTVISYEFTDGSESNFLRKNRMKIYVSLGKEELKDTITVPNLSGKVKGDVIGWASENNIDVEVLEDYNEYVEYGKVYHQSIEGNTKMKRDDKLTVTLSLGKAIIVPSFVGLQRDEALDIAKLDNMELFFKNQISTKKEGTIISQDIEPGTTVSSKELVTITVAASSDMVIVPDLVGLDQSEASTLASLYNIRTFFVTKSSTEKSGKVIDQSHSKGTSISSETLVTIYVSSGDVSLPDFVGLSKDDAGLLAEEFDLTLIFKEEDSASVVKDQILSQSIDPETVIDKDTKLILTIANNNGHIVPNFDSMTRTQVELWASSHDTPIQFVEEYSNYAESGVCFKQNYENQYLPGNESLLVYQSLGRIPISDFTGQSKITLGEWLNEVNSKGGNIDLNILTSTSTTKPQGTIVGQSIVNDYVLTGTRIDVWVAGSSINNTIPDFTGLKEEKAIEWCDNNNVNYSIVDRYSSDYPKERICGQNITGKSLSTGEPLLLYRSIGPLYMPSFVGRGKADLVKWINEQNLLGAGITLDFTYVYSGNNYKDIVNNQSVSQENIDTDSILRVVLTAPEYVDVPDFTNMTLSDAIEKLESMDVKYETKYIYVSESAAVDAPKDTIINQSSSGEMKFQGHEPIVFTVSNGAKY